MIEPSLAVCGYLRDTCCKLFYNTPGFDVPCFVEMPDVQPGGAHVGLVTLWRRMRQLQPSGLTVELEAPCEFEFVISTL